MNRIETQSSVWLVDMMGLRYQRLPKTESERANPDESHYGYYGLEDGEWVDFTHYQFVVDHFGLRCRFFIKGDVIRTGVIVDTDLPVPPELAAQAAELAENLG